MLKTLESLFRSPAPAAPPPGPQERTAPTPSATDENAPPPAIPLDLVTLTKPGQEVLRDAPPEPSPAVLAAPDPDRNVRAMSPRQLASLAQELYLSGKIGFEDFRVMGAPPELDPRYDATVGKLTGERADPDRPRDMIAVWEENVAFAQENYTERPDIIARSERILSMLKYQEIPRFSLEV